MPTDTIVTINKMLDTVQEQCASVWESRRSMNKLPRCAPRYIERSTWGKGTSAATSALKAAVKTYFEERPDTIRSLDVFKSMTTACRAMLSEDKTQAIFSS